MNPKGFFTIIAEVKENNKWKLYGYNKNGLLSNFSASIWTSDVSGDRIFQKLFSNTTPKNFTPSISMDTVPCICNESNGKPDDMSDDIKTVIKVFKEIFNNKINISGYITSDNIKNFNWNFNITKMYPCTQQEINEYHDTGKIPEIFISPFRRNLPMAQYKYFKCDIPFKVLYPGFINLIEYFNSNTEDYRLLYYFEKIKGDI